ncbi:MAG: hypothetical protein LBP35_00330 [Candidatus Ancillula trichonymphae]|jgi:hypothetical protein|nr:hypothetical protein [Candidatus Ancillula trichonymphae]
MFGILKITQSNKGKTWKFVPLQNFTENSDIDWSCTIPEIDAQLYEKYQLTGWQEFKYALSHNIQGYELLKTLPEDSEVYFIETKVKEMK